MMGILSESGYLVTERSRSTGFKDLQDVDIKHSQKISLKPYFFFVFSLRPLRLCGSFIHLFMAFLDKITIKSCSAGILPPRIIHIKAKLQFDESLCRLILV